MVLSLYGGRLLQLQGLDPGAYAARAAAESRVTVPLAARRGEILDRNGEPLATSVNGLAIAVDPALTKNVAPELAKFFATRLDVDYFTVLRRLRGDGHFAFVARQVPATLANDVVRQAKAAGFEGIYTELDPVRDYPAHDVAANLVGFMGQEKAYAGLELAFDNWLSGKNGKEQFVLVSGGNRLPLGDTSITEPVDGQDVQLTIDRDLQWFTQRVLRKSVLDARADSGVAVVMDTRTGEVLSLADYPTFDAAAPDYAPAHDRGSRALSDVYEPGSVQKVMTVASLLDAGKVTPRTKIRVPGTLERSAKVLHDWWDHGPLRLTMAGVIAKSSNIGTVLAADQLTRATAARLPGELRSGLADRHRRLQGVEGHPPFAGGLDTAHQGPDRVRPVRLRQRPPDGRRNQHRRQRRSPNPTQPHPWHGHDRRGRRRRH